MLQIGFIVPSSYYLHDPFRGDPHTHLQILTVLAERLGSQANCILIDLRGIERRYAVNHIPECDVYLHSVYTLDWDEQIDVVQQLRLYYPKAVHIAGGPHVVEFPAQALEVFDAVVIGGGSPTILDHRDFSRLIAGLGTIVDLSTGPRFSLEVDPRTVTADDLHFYADQGVNRLSFGVQDFDPQVQQAIGRVQPAGLLDDLLAPGVRKRFDGINFDILCGLPRQTVGSFRQTIATTIQYQPDRIMLMFFNYCPQLRRHQQAISASELPSLEQKLQMFEDAVAALTSAGYGRIGFDHFAMPNDQLSQAMEHRNIHWNSLGYRPGPCVDMLGIGAGSISRITDQYYFQNHYLEGYASAVDAGRLPVEKCYWLTFEDRLRREVIHQLRCYLAVDWTEISARYGIKATDFFGRELSTLRQCQTDGIVAVAEDRLSVTPTGTYFLSYICSVFDAFARRNDHAG